LTGRDVPAHPGRPFREHLRRRRAQDPGVSQTQLLREITALGYKGSANLLARYMSQGRVEAENANLSAKKAAGLLLTDPAKLDQKEITLRDKLAAACPEMTELSAPIGRFAAMLTPQAANAARLGQWITQVRMANLPTLGSYATGLQRDQAAVEAALTLPYHNGRTEGVNHKVKLLKRRPTAEPASRCCGSGSCSADRHDQRSPLTKILEEPLTVQTLTAADPPPSAKLTRHHPFEFNSGMAPQTARSPSAREDLHRRPLPVGLSGRLLP
jgi:transposase